MGSRLLPARLRLLLGVGLVALAVSPRVVHAMARVQTDTVKAEWVNWGSGELDSLLTGVRSLVQTGFGAAEQAEIAKDMFSVVRATGLRSDGGFNLPARAYTYAVRFRERPSELYILISTVDFGTFDVTIESSDSALVAAIRGQIRAAYLASLKPVGRVELRFVEQGGQSGRMPRIVLSVVTVDEEMGVGYHIAHTLDRRGDTLSLRLLGIAKPKGLIGFPMVTPASLSEVISLLPGRYPLVVSANGDENRFVLAVTDTSLAIVAQRATFVEVSERPRWRYPRNSFVLRCSEVAVRTGLCMDVERWLGRQPGITRAIFSPEGVSPFSHDPPRTSRRFPSEQSAAPVAQPLVFQYATPEAFLPVRRCFASFKEQIRLAVGVTFELETSTGETLTAWSTRSYHEQHIAVPATVTRTVECRTSAPTH